MKSLQYKPVAVSPCLSSCCIRPTAAWCRHCNLCHSSSLSSQSAAPATRCHTSAVSQSCTQYTKFTATSQRCRLTVQSVTKDIFVWTVGPRCSTNYQYFHCLLLVFCRSWKTAGQWLLSLGRRQSTMKNSGHSCKTSLKQPWMGIMSRENCRGGFLLPSSRFLLLSVLLLDSSIIDICMQGSCQRQPCCHRAAMVVQERCCVFKR